MLRDVDASSPEGRAAVAWAHWMAAGYPPGWLGEDAEARAIVFTRYIAPMTDEMAAVVTSTLEAVAELTGAIGTMAAIAREELRRRELLWRYPSSHARAVHHAIYRSTRYDPY